MIHRVTKHQVDFYDVLKPKIIRIDKWENGPEHKVPILGMERLNPMSCCAMWVLKNMASSDMSSVPTEIIDEFISIFCDTSMHYSVDALGKAIQFQGYRPQTTDYIATTPDYQLYPNCFVRISGLYDFKVHEAANRVHGPSTVTTLIIKTQEWENIWKDKYRDAHVRMYQKYNKDKEIQL